MFNNDKNRRGKKESNYNCEEKKLNSRNTS